MPPSNHNEVCRSRMEDILSKTTEGKDMVEGGYARLASAAQRIAERQNMDAGESTAPGPPTTAGGGEPQSEEDDTSVKKRPRHGSVVDSPPSTDEAGAGAGNDQQAKGTPRCRNPMLREGSVKLSREFKEAQSDRATEMTQSALTWVVKKNRQVP